MEMKTDSFSEERTRNIVKRRLLVNPYGPDIQTEVCCFSRGRWPELEKRKNRTEVFTNPLQTAMFPILLPQLVLSAREWTVTKLQGEKATSQSSRELCHSWAVDFCTLQHFLISWVFGNSQKGSAQWGRADFVWFAKTPNRTKSARNWTKSALCFPGSAKPKRKSDKIGANRTFSDIFGLSPFRCPLLGDPEVWETIFLPLLVLASPVKTSTGNDFPRKYQRVNNFPQYGWDFPEEIPEEFRKDPGNALRVFPGISLESTAGIPQTL